MSANAQTLRPAPAIRVKQIALPTEHGGWGFLLEPIVAALAVAFSVGGLWIALTFVGAFLMRQPLKIYILDRRGMRVDARAQVALRYLLIYATVLCAGLAGTLLTCSASTYYPLVAVLPLAALQNYYDVFRRSRNLVPELAGAIAISSSAAAIVLAGGQGAALAIGLWLVIVARLIPSIIYVRERLLLEKGKPISRIATTVSHALGVAVVAVLAAGQWTSVLVVPVMIFMLYRAIAGLSPGRAPLKAMQVGIREVIYGAALVLALAVGRYFGV